MSETTPTHLPVVFCPVCVTPDDATGWGAQDMECGACGTKYTVVLVPEVVAQHSGF